MQVFYTRVFNTRVGENLNIIGQFSEILPGHQNTAGRNRGGCFSLILYNLIMACWCFFGEFSF